MCFDCNNCITFAHLLIYCTISTQNHIITQEEHSEQVDRIIRQASVLEDAEEVKYNQYHSEEVRKDSNFYNTKY